MSLSHRSLAGIALAAVALVLCLTARADAAPTH